MTVLSPTLRAWLQLVRPPNLFTVPGDPLAGFVAASASQGQTPDLRLAVLPALASLLLYVGGLIGNDVADEAEDRRDRPSRPIPSGRVTRRAAFAASALCALGGLVLALVAGWQVFVAAALTQLAIMAYNGGLKRHAVIGALAMGACRGGSVFVGAAAGSGRPLPAFVWVLAAGVTFYIGAVTWIADRETETRSLGFRRWLPVSVLSLMFGPFAVSFLGALLLAPMGRTVVHGAREFTVYLLCGGLAVAWSVRQAWLLRGTPPPQVVGRSVGALIRGLLLVQAAFCALGGVPGLAAAAALLVLWPVSARVGKWFYAS
jgi:4-hydroxybenzoate polyprenyltransferase